MLMNVSEIWFSQVSIAPTTFAPGCTPTMHYSSLLQMAIGTHGTISLIIFAANIQNNSDFVLLSFTFNKCHKKLLHLTCYLWCNAITKICNELMDNNFTAGNSYSIDLELGVKNHEWNVLLVQSLMLSLSAEPNKNRLHNIFTRHQ